MYAPLQKALRELNYETPTPIQSQTIPPAIEGADILGCAQTGTGKTASFALPILDYLGLEEPNVISKRPNSLILAPTRELAIQISDSFNEYGKHMRFSQALVYGGVGQGKQVAALKRGVDVLIATPGRLVDLMQQNHVSLDNVQIFVLDEADRMLDMGFLPDLRKIVAALPKQRQSLFFSATLPPKSRSLAKELLFNPVSINVTPESPSVERIDQKVMLLEKGKKFTQLDEILSGKSAKRSIVFTRTKRGANQVAKKLDAAGIRAVAIHGNKSQNARERALDSFRRNKVTVLVATDVAARGIDIDGVSHVINYDMPVEAESYVHRIGRTGRAGADGIAISFCTPTEKAELVAIEKLIEQSLDCEEPFGPIRFEAAPKKGSGNSRSRHGNRGRRHSGGNTGGGGSSRASGKRGGQKSRRRKTSSAR
ncbi:DEAD/DEAH box helicase [Mariniblastus fucicola]|uniref:ATP-dependent RNA helicase RhlE n=1 Tax=Mariniblastus fucicola TaxID=980251 RepID=A0A5B9PEV4_9BACT|nr:DEAD/DEAH box helicase [Mariniblastus fucicola]QEG24938.1 ATP-dependent RNA helicase RhlE [Mariniblastus fucicola]